MEKEEIENQSFKIKEKKNKEEWFILSMASFLNF